MRKHDFIENMISFFDQCEPRRITRSDTWSDAAILLWSLTKEGHNHWDDFWREITEKDARGDNIGHVIDRLKECLRDVIPEENIDRIEEMLLGDEGDRKMAVIILRHYYNDYAGPNPLI
jgi:hypothetical protein